MVSKSKRENAGKKKKIKVLNLKKETVKNLTDDESKRVKGGTTQCLIGARVSLRVYSGVQLDSLGGQSSVPYSG